VEKFGCGIDAAENTIKATTQFAEISALRPLSRRYRTDILQTGFRRLNVEFFTDTMFPRVKGLKGSKAAQVFTDGKFVWVLPINSKKFAGEALKELIHEVGIPARLRFDGSKEQVCEGKEFMKTIRKRNIKWRTIEPYSHWQNRAKDQIQEIRQKWRTIKQKKNITERL
jgi:hypothetical protein